MPRKKIKKTHLPDDQQRLTLPDEAIYYVVSNYLQRRTKTSGVSVIVGVSTETVEEILRHFVDWAALHGHIKEGVLTIGGEVLE